MPANTPPRSPLTGLTAGQVAERIAAGKVNVCGTSSNFSSSKSSSVVAFFSSSDLSLSSGDLERDRDLDRDADGVLEPDLLLDLDVLDAFPVDGLVVAEALDVALGVPSSSSVAFTDDFLDADLSVADGLGDLDNLLFEDLLELSLLLL